MQFSIYRFFAKGGRIKITSVRTLKEAQEHCENPQSSSDTCTGFELVRYTVENGAWFDMYNELPDHMLTEEWQIGR